jgi:hypothetical protein
LALDRKWIAAVVVPAAFVAAGAAPGGEGPTADPSAAQTLPQPAVADLLDLVDPGADDWTAEHAQGETGDVLARLARAVEQGTPALAAPLFAPAAKATALRPAGLARRRLAGGLEVLRAEGASTAEPAEPAERALAELVAPLRGADGLRCSFKIVGVEGEAGAGLRTRVRYEAAGRSSAGHIEQTANWWVDWSGSGASLRIAAIRLERLVEAARPSFMLTESTGAVLAPGAASVDNLRRGGEFWHGRIDAVGEPNLMGHHGLALGDFDGNGLEDLYVAMGTGLPNLLLRQDADGTLRDVAEEAGVAWLDDTKGVLFADTDNDGDQDLLMAIGPTIVLAKNGGKGRFERFVSMRAPTPAPFYSLSAADYDLDGDLDIYGARYVEVAYGVSVPLPFHDANNGPPNHLLRNDGEDRFTDVTTAVGLDVNNRRFSLIGAWRDYDLDGDDDLYVANDFGRNNLFRNEGGRFVDVAAEAGAEDQAAGMGVSWSDYDLDGDLDLYVTNMFSAAGSRIAYQPRFQSDDGEARRQAQRHSLGNSLLANQGDGTFRDVSDEAGVRMGRWGWGGMFADFNNDGLDDLVVPNGFLTGAIADDL